MKTPSLSFEHALQQEPHTLLARVFGRRASFLLAFFMLIPSALVRGGDGVGVDGLIGSLPQRRGPNGECFFSGLAASFVPLPGTYWGQVPGVASMLVFEGDAATVTQSMVLSRKVSSSTQVGLGGNRLAQIYGCDVDITVDYQALAASGCNTFLQLPASYVLTAAAGYSSNGVQLSPPVSAAARHYYMNLAFIANSITQWHLPDIEVAFLDPQGSLVRAHFALEAGTYLRIRVF